MKKEFEEYMEPKYFHVTPEWAKDMLENHNHHNRPISAASVAKFKVAMYEGTFNPGNGETIKVAFGGELLDGQHRLKAIAETGKDYWMIVVFGCDPSSFDTIDCGRTRTPRDVLYVGGFKNATNLAATIGVIVQLRKTGQLPYLCGPAATNAERLKVAEQDSERILEAVAYGQNLYRDARTVSPAWIAGMYYYLTKDLGYKDEFVKTFMDGAFSNETAENNIVNALRKFANANFRVNSKRRVSRKYMAGILAKAWNLYRKKERRFLLKIIDGEEIQKIE